MNVEKRDGRFGVVLESGEFKSFPTRELAYQFFRRAKNQPKDTIEEPKVEKNKNPLVEWLGKLTKKEDDEIKVENTSDSP